MKSDQAAVISELHTLRDFMRWALSEFSRHQVFLGHGHAEAWDEASQLVLNAVDLPWDTNPAVLDGRLTQAEKARVVDFVSQRTLERKPLPYITGEAWFMGLPFNVDERVLIPRSPVAELIAAGFEPWLRPGPINRILDLCTGSGCIGIACAYAFEEAEVDLADISADALEVAQGNIARHALEDRVRACQGDLFAAVEGETYDLIVSNPPYVDADDLASMPEEYGHEPALALGSGPDGLDITRRILQQAAQHLMPEGLLVVEVGNSEVHLMQSLPELPLVWVELEQGGNGIFVITAEELRAHADLL